MTDSQENYQLDLGSEMAKTKFKRRTFRAFKFAEPNSFSSFSSDQSSFELVRTGSTKRLHSSGRLENFDRGAASIQTGNFYARLESQPNKQ